MSFLDRFRKRKEPAPIQAGEPDAFEYGFNPEAHHILLEYYRKIRDGAPPDPTFERKCLSRDFHFTTLNLAEMIFAIAKEQEIALDTILDFMACSIPGGGDALLATLMQRLAILAESFSEKERDVLLASGVVGDRKEILPLYPHFDYVEYVIKYCRAIESLKGDETFGRRHGGTVEIEDDPEWQ